MGLEYEKNFNDFYDRREGIDLELFNSAPFIDEFASPCFFLRRNQFEISKERGFEYPETLLTWPNSI